MNLHNVFILGYTYTTNAGATNWCRRVGQAVRKRETEESDAPQTTGKTAPSRRSEEYIMIDNL